MQKKYRQLFLENNRLKEEVKKLRVQPDLTAGREESHYAGNATSKSLVALEPELFYM